MNRVIAFADEDIPYGARVLVRGMRASLASGEIANGTAAPRPRWLREGDVIPARASFSVAMDSGIGERSLATLANGPIMDPCRLYLPAGKLSMDEFRERQRSIILEPRP